MFRLWIVFGLMAAARAQDELPSCDTECTSALPAECGGVCPFALFAQSGNNDDNTSASEQLCDPTCERAWTGARECLVAQRPENAQLLDAMVTTCDTLCFLEDGVSLQTFQQACASVFSDGTCADECRQLVTVTLDRQCRNNIVAALDTSISGAAVAVFGACGAEYDPLLDCSDACSQALPAACQGTCPFELMRNAGDYDNEWGSAGTLCAADCRAAWNAEDYRRCLSNADSQDKLVAIERANSATCPSSCFVAAFALPANQQAASECMALAQNATSACSPACRVLLESLGTECRASTVTSGDAAIAATARATFDACDVSYDGAASDTQPALTLTVVLALAAGAIVAQKLLRIG